MTRAKTWLLLAVTMAAPAIGCVYVMHQQEFRPAELRIDGLDSARQSSVWVLERKLAYEIATALDQGLFPIERLGLPVETMSDSSGHLVASVDGYAVRACDARPLGIPMSRRKARPQPLLVVVIQPGSSPEYTVIEVVDVRHTARFSVVEKEGGVEVLEVISGHPTIDVTRGRSGDKIRVQMSRTSRFDS